MSVQATAITRYPVTVVIPTKNEEMNLAQCLNTVRGFQDVVVIDSGSTDATAKIATNAGAKVIKFEWKGGFPKKRNWVLMNYDFHTEWVLFLDADERLTEEFRNEMADRIEEEG